MIDRLGQLPEEPADWVTKPLVRFLRVESLAGAILLLSALLALILSNTTWAHQFLALWETEVGIRIGRLEFDRSLKHWINDGLMTLFFFVVALELKRELVLGELRNPRLAALPLLAALGGMLVPVGVFLMFAGGGSGASGWGTVMSTDTAFVIGCLAVLGSRVSLSLRLFLLSLAIFDDIGAILVVAIGYGEAIDWWALGCAALLLCIVAGIARAGVRNLLIYGAAGIAVWMAFDVSGIHPTLAGVILGLMTPTGRWVSGTRLRAILDRITHPPAHQRSDDGLALRNLRRARIATREAVSPVERLELALHPWVAFVVMPLFALANAGIPIAETKFEGTLATAIVVAFAVGKPIGVVGFSVLAVTMGVAIRPPELRWGELAAGSLLTGIGFTMALFIAELAFPAALLDSVKLGILGASAASAVGGLVALGWLTSRTPGVRNASGAGGERME